jgi:hypothetical protein
MNKETIKKRICKNCKFVRQWGKENKDRLFCALATSIDGDALFESKAVAQDYESYQATLDVKPTFGCNQFKNRIGNIVIVEELSARGLKI